MEEGGWFTQFPEGSHGVGLCKAISKEGTQLKNNCTFIFGNGRRTKFWEDVWYGEGPLKENFTSLYSLAEKRRGAFRTEVWDVCMGEGV